MSTIVLGAGITGLSAAYALQEAGRPCSAYEQAPVPGGLCGTVSQDGFTYDTISHVLHFHTPQVRQLVLDLLDGDVLEIRRRAAIYWNGSHVPYPFQTNLAALPARDAIACFMAMLAAHTRHSLDGAAPVNFSDWIDRQFGSGIRARFMQPYNEKVWGTSLKDLSTDWMRFVPSTSVRDVLRSMFADRNDAGYNASFVVPRRGGIARLVDAFARRLSLHVCKRAVAVSLKDRIVRFADGTEATYTTLISSIPLSLLAEITTDAPDEIRGIRSRLSAVRVVVLTYGLRRPLPHDCHWLYFPEKRFPFFRLFFTSNVNPAQAPPRMSIVSAEIAVNLPYELETMKRQTFAALQELGYVENSADIATFSQHDFAYGYPRHDIGRAECVRVLRDFYRRHGVETAGRFGAWRYSSIDDDIADGLAVATAACSSSP